MDGNETERERERRDEKECGCDGGMGSGVHLPKSSGMVKEGIVEGRWSGVEVGFSGKIKNRADGIRRMAHTQFHVVPAVTLHFPAKTHTLFPSAQ
jgi:hypothetical protein